MSIGKWKQMLAEMARAERANSPPTQSPNANDPLPADITERASTLVDRYLGEIADIGAFYPATPSTLSSGQNVLESELRVQAAVFINSCWRLPRLRDNVAEGIKDTYWQSLGLKALSIQLAKRALPLTDSELLSVLNDATKPKPSWDLPWTGLVRLIERRFPSQSLSPDFVEPLKAVRGMLEQFFGSSKDNRKLIQRIDVLCGGEIPSAPNLMLEPGDAWSDLAIAGLDRNDPSKHHAWDAIINYARSTTGSKPSGKWIKTARPLLHSVGDSEFRDRVSTWLDMLGKPGSSPASVYSTITGRHELEPTLIRDGNAEILKGLIWCCAALPEPNEAICAAIGRAAETCYKKIPMHGPRCVKVANACVVSLAEISSSHSVAQISRIQSRVKYNSARSLIAGALRRAADRAGITTEDLQEGAVPTFGLDTDGTRTESLGEFTAILKVIGSDCVELTWIKSGGKAQRSVPQSVKDGHPEQLKELKRAVKEIERILPAQRDRIEQFFLQPRSWSFATWRQRYLDHPLIMHLARRLIWHFQDGDRRIQGGLLDGRIVDADDQPIDGIGDQTKVELWHPIGISPESVLAWRRWLERHRITQPFKQAHREVYILTDAELRTETYSNRFAAHILRQHQLHALCQQRGWVYRLQGAHFDSANYPTLGLPQHEMRVEYWIEIAGGEEVGLGIAPFVATDQVRFYNSQANEPLRLADIPALLFTEVMRHVDLFVGVCSVGNDPTWGDRGVTGRYGDYWQQVSFGDLSASAKTRREVLERIVPRLKIAGRCSLSDKFLVVRGDLRTYKIHLGSGNILMEPNDQYLCIVPGRSAVATDGKTYLPFEGDGVLAIILSKALLLAADTKITDESITRQIGR